jgi:hypothetical protein
MNNRIKSVLNNIVGVFKSGEIPDAVAIACYPAIDVPSSKWSLINRTLMILADTYDARGFRQWQQSNRKIKKGSKAFYILVPNYRRTDDTITGEQEVVLLGFMCKPVFRVEDTDGEALEYDKLKLPRFPLIKRAREWGISIKAIPRNYQYYGSYTPHCKEISLATPEEKVFFHELAHAGHEKIKGSIQCKQDPTQEIVAELTAAALCKLVGKSVHDTLGNSYRYINKYAQDLNINAHIACVRVLLDTEKVLNLILKGETNVERTDNEKTRTYSKAV